MQASIIQKTGSSSNKPSKLANRHVFRRDLPSHQPPLDSDETFGHPVLNYTDFLFCFVLKKMKYSLLYSGDITIS